MHRGRVTSLHRWPVKSFAGERLDALELDPTGVLGDRRHAVHDLKLGRPLSARAAPGLLRWSARLPGTSTAPLVTAPDGRAYMWDDEALPGAVAADLRRDVRLVHDPVGMQDLGHTVLVTLEATRLGVEAELGRPLDLRRFRTNLHLDVEGAGPRDELGWEGRRLRVGDAELELLHPCERCAITLRDPDTNAVDVDVLRTAPVFGVNARPLGRARVVAGDPVEVVG